MPKNNKITVQKNFCRKKGNYYLEETIGEGAFAKVKLAIHIPTGEKVAIKILNKDHLFDGALESNDIQKIRKEINILKRIKHKNIIQLYEIMESKSNLYIVMEYCENKELFDYIISKKYLKEKEACRFFQQIIDGVEYLHLSNITHRDLKPENLLLDKNHRIKISDFGLSYLGNSIDTLIETPCGTPSYAPPEMLKGEKYNGVYSDIWSCGIILYTMLVGNLPCAESKEELIYENIMQHNYYFPDNISKEAKDLIKNMLKINPKDRYDFEQIKSHPWFNKVKPKLKPGIVYGVHKIPVDDYILARIEKYGYDKEKCRKSISNYIYDENSSIYYLTLKQLIREKKASISDLFSDEYVKYLKDYKNWIKPDEINNPLFINYQAEMPFEIEQEEAKNYISNALLEYNNKDNKDVNNPLNAENPKEKNIKIFKNEIRQNENEKQQDSQKVIKINNEKDKKNINTKVKKNSAKTILTSRLEKNEKKKKIRKNVSSDEMPIHKIKNIKIKDIIKKNLKNKKVNVNEKKEEKIRGKFIILTKRNNESFLNRSKFINNDINAKKNFINKSAKTRKKHKILDSVENNKESKKENNIKKEIKFNKIDIAKNINKNRNNSIIKKNSSNKLNKFIDISKIESPKEESESISFNSKILSPRAFSSLSNEINSNNISEISKKIELYYNKQKSFKKKTKEQNDISNLSTDIIFDKLKQEEKIKLRNKLENEQKNFMNEMNIINNITTDTTTASINNSNSGIGSKKNLIHLMATKMLKNSVFSKYLIKNKNEKKIIKGDLEHKFYTLQKYKDIIGLIENLKKKIFKKKFIDFNYQSFDDYLNDDDDKLFSQSFINKTKINSFLKKAKFSLYQKEKQKKRAYSKANNLNLKFNKINNIHILKQRYVTEQKNLEKIKPKRNFGYYNPKKNLNLTYLISDENNNNKKQRRSKYRKKTLDNSEVNSIDKSINSSNSYIQKAFNKKFFSSENTKDKNLNINLKTYKFNNKNINKNESFEYDSDISFSSNNTKVINKTKTNINNSGSLIKDIHENDESLSSNKNINISKEENGIYKKNKNITTPQLGTKIINNNIFNQNSPSKYDADEKDQFIMDNISLMINNTKNQKKEISIKNNEQLIKEIWELNDKNTNNENNSRNIITSNTGINSTVSMNKTNMTFSGKNKSKKYIKIKSDFPIDLNCVIDLPFDEIKYRIKLYFKKAGFFYTEKGNIIKVKRGNTNIEIILYKLQGENNFFYLSTKIKSNELKKEKENLRKLISILNTNNKV